MLPCGLMTAVLLWLIQSQADEFIMVFGPDGVSTFTVVAYHLGALMLSLVATLAIPFSAAWLFDKLAEQETPWVWALLFLIPLTSFGCTWLSIRAEAMLLPMLFSAIFLTSLFCAAYCGILWLERLLLYFLSGRPTAKSTATLRG